MQNKTINQLGLLIQAVLLVGVIYTYILTLFMKEFQVVLVTVLGLTLFSMAYNNATIFGKKGMTLCYSVVGIICLVIGIMM